MTKSNFLCANCRGLLCYDCKSIADEYEELLTMKNRALSNADREIEELKTQLEAVKRKSAMWEQLSKMGMPEIILKWMDDQSARVPLPH